MSLKPTSGLAGRLVGRGLGLEDVAELDPTVDHGLELGVAGMAEPDPTEIRGATVDGARLHPPRGVQRTRRQVGRRVGHEHGHDIVGTVVALADRSLVRHDLDQLAGYATECSMALDTRAAVPVDDHLRDDTVVVYPGRLGRT
jgi:hypothetical protein